jgi:hypothetical protein
MIVAAAICRHRRSFPLVARSFRGERARASRPSRRRPISRLPPVNDRERGPRSKWRRAYLLDHCTFPGDSQPCWHFEAGPIWNPYSAGVGNPPNVRSRKNHGNYATDPPNNKSPVDQRSQSVFVDRRASSSRYIAHCGSIANSVWLHTK